MSDAPQQAETPRTDIESFRSTAQHGVGMGKFVTAEFARTLERELDFAKAGLCCANAGNTGLSESLTALRAERDALMADKARLEKAVRILRVIRDANKSAGYRTDVSDQFLAEFDAARSSGGKERAT